MRKKIYLAIVFMGVVACSVQAEEPVYFADAQLKACIEEHLGVSNPTPTDMLTLIELNCSNRGIVDLTGLEYAKNLTTLCLNNNQISDVSALSGLKNLAALDLNRNLISDISVLLELASIQTLNLEYNQIDNISAISALTNLTGLWLGFNQISDISPLSNLTNLEMLMLEGNQITDISKLSRLTNLEVLNLSDNQVNGISVVSGLSNMTELNIGGNNISDISALSGLMNLKRLWLYGNQIVDFSPISGLTDLELLHLGSSGFSDFFILSALTNLVELTLSANNLKDLNAMSGLTLTNLTHLDVRNNNIDDFSGISGLTNLTWLQVEANQIKDISALSGLTNLMFLFLINNDISDISAVSGLMNLTQLYLDENYITDITPLSMLTNLKMLNLRQNEISNISSLLALKNLVYLNLQRNRLDTEAYLCHLPLIKKNNPGITILPDPCPNLMTGDLNGDCHVDMRDLKIMAEEWLASGIKLDSDVYEDGNVDFGDYSILTHNWLPRGMQWYVSPDGSPSGDGSTENPWDLSIALGNSVTIRPGDTVWLTGGTYRGPFVKTQALSGVLDAPIIYRAMPSQRVTLTADYTDLNVLVNDADYVWFWDFEVTAEGDANTAPCQCRGVLNGPGIGSKYINIIVHDCPESGFVGQATGGEYCGCMAYRNGWQSDFYGHGFYCTNRIEAVDDSVDDLPWMKLTDCVAFDNYGWNIHSYGSSLPGLVNMLYEGIVAFGIGNGNFLSGSRQHDDNLVIRNCFTYYSKRGRSSAEFGYNSSTNGRLTIENNVFVGGRSAIGFNNWEQATFQYNKCYIWPSDRSILGVYTLPDVSMYLIDNNTYYQEESNIYHEGPNPIASIQNAPYYMLESWHAATGWDLNSRVISGQPNDLWVFLRPNKYEPDRAHLIIYNWPKTETVSVEMANLWPDDNHQYKYRIVNVEDIWGDPVAQGTLMQGLIEVPITGAYAPEFACYLVTRSTP